MYSWYSIIGPGDPFHKVFMRSWSKSCTNIWCSYMKNNLQIKSQFCTCHDSTAVMTCAKLWHDGIIRIKIKGKGNGTWFQWWTNCEMGQWGWWSAAGIYGHSHHLGGCLSPAWSCCAQHSFLDPFWRHLEGPRFPLFRWLLSGPWSQTGSQQGAQ